MQFRLTFMKFKLFIGLCSFDDWANLFSCKFSTDLSQICFDFNLNFLQNVEIRSLVLLCLPLFHTTNFQNQNESERSKCFHSKLYKERISLVWRVIREHLKVIAGVLVNAFQIEAISPENPCRKDNFTSETSAVFVNVSCRRAWSQSTENFVLC